MKFFRTEALAYTVLLIILFAISSLAVVRIIHVLGDVVPGDVSPAIAVAIWSLTLGFMFIAGAFGLWGIKLSAEAEGRRRVGRFVDEMDYIRDAVLTVDRRGHITGSNPAAHSLGNFNGGESPLLAAAFPCLDAADVTMLSHPTDPVEVERVWKSEAGQRVMRFRAQPAQGLALLLISDVTQMNAKRLRNRQMVRLQLLEHIAKGVVHDVNMLLCGISGHASLLARMPPGSAEAVAALGAIDDATRRGSIAASRLLDLVQPSQSPAPRTDVAEPIENAAALLRDTLSRGWEIEVAMEPVAQTALTAAQLEQLVLNLGVLVADAHLGPGSLSIAVKTPHSLRAENAADYVGAIVIRAKEDAESAAHPVESSGASEVEPGIIQSVLESVVSGCGGRLESLRSRALAPMYVVWLPRAETDVRAEDRTELPEELGAYVANWRVLLASARPRQALRERLAGLGSQVDVVDNVVSALTQMEKHPAYDGAVFDIGLLRHEAAGLLRALLKLSPRTGFVACGDQREELISLSSDVVFVPEWSLPDRVVLAIMEARTLGLKRSQT